MSAVYVVATIIALVGALICYQFIAQTLEKKRKQRLRLLQALNQRAKVFRYILSGFPAHFLPKELTLLVQRCLTDVLQQLAALEPAEKQHLEELAQVAILMDATHKREEQVKRTPLESPQQVKDVKLHLQELYKFLMNLERKGTIKHAEAQVFGLQIRQLVLQISVDSYILQAKRAKQAGKLRLAVHYFSLAKKLLERDDDDRYATQVAKLDIVIKQLEETLGETVGFHGDDSEALQDKAWDEMTDTDSWKKKNIYD